MSIRRLFPAAAALLAAAFLFPATAGAFGWTEMELLNAPGSDVAQLSNASVNNRISAGDDGTIAAAWAEHKNGHDVLVVRRFSGAGDSWDAPQDVSPAGEDVAIFDLVVDKDGNTTAFWAPPNFTDLRTSTMLAGSTTWSDTETLATSVYGLGFAAAPNGTVTAAYVVPGSGPNEIRTATRTRNSADWGTPVTVPTVDAVGGSLALDFNASGDAILYSQGQTSGVTKGYVSRWDAGSETWSGTPTEVFANVASGGTGMVDAVLKNDGSAAVVSVNGNFEALARTIGADGSLGDDHQLSGALQLIPQLAIDAAGRIVVTWEALDLGTGAAESWYSVVEPGSGSWSTAARTPRGTAGAPITLTSNDRGVVRLVFADGASIADISDFGIATTEWSSQTGSWGPLENVEGASATVFNAFSMTGHGSSPVAALTADGDLATMWSQNTTPGNHGVGFAAGDGTAPVVSAVSVPSSATTGDPVPVSVSATDRWSDVGSVSWAFGDGETGSGASATHAYPTAGTYTVTVTVTDTAGNSATETRHVTVSDPPPAPDDADEPEQKPKQTLAPVIEARLAGRTISLNAKVTLKKGARCSGTVKATTAFGGRSYRTTLKLKTIGGACRGTGTISLKKTPSLRTKLRITVAGKQVKSRTLTTRRG